MRRFIITGAPGAGKTAIIRQLELDGFSVVEEAATDVIAAAQSQLTTLTTPSTPFLLSPWRGPNHPPYPPFTRGGCSLAQAFSPPCKGGSGGVVVAQHPPWLSRGKGGVIAQHPPWLSRLRTQQ